MSTTRKKKVSTQTVRSAGGVVLRRRGEALDALLIATHGGRRWSLPKGRIEPGESREEAALREVLEETGIHGEILAPIETVEYWFFARRNLRLHKFVDYFLMAYVSGDPVPQLSEVEAVEWWPLDQALRKVTYKNDRRLLRKARTLWDKTPPER